MNFHPSPGGAHAQLTNGNEPGGAGDAHVSNSQPRPDLEAEIDALLVRLGTYVPWDVGCSLEQEREIEARVDELIALLCLTPVDSGSTLVDDEDRDDPPFDSRIYDIPARGAE